MMRLRKLSAVLLAIALVLGLGASVSAATTADTKGSITITTNDDGASIAGKTFSAYRIFDVTAADTTTPADGSYDAYASYAFSAEWAADFFAGEGLSTAAAAVQHLGTLSSNSAQMQAFAEKIGAYIRTNSVAAAGSATAGAQAATVTIGDLPIGYYVVLDDGATETTAVSACMINYTSPHTSIKIKADNVPPFNKTVAGGVNNEVFGAVGTQKEFTLTSAMPNVTFYKNYVLTFTDSMSEGLTFDASTLKVKLGETEYPLTEGSFNNAAIAYTAGENGFTVTLTLKENDATTAIYENDKAIAITYNATINDKAVAGSAETNSATLTYTNTPSGETATTPPIVVKVYTVQIDLTKTDGETPITTDTASFALYGPDQTLANAQVPEGVDATKTVGESDGAKTYYYYNTYTTSTTDGKLAIAGLDAATYYLRETKAPDGYNLLTQDIAIVVTPGASGAITYTVDGGENTNSATGHVVLNVANSTGTLLPSTGGMGTALFTLGGCAILAGAGLILVVNRKRLFSK